MTSLRVLAVAFNSYRADILGDTKAVQLVPMEFNGSFNVFEKIVEPSGNLKQPQTIVVVETPVVDVTRAVAKYSSAQNFIVGGEANMELKTTNLFALPGIKGMGEYFRLREETTSVAEAQRSALCSKLNGYNLSLK